MLGYKIIFNGFIGRNDKAIKNTQIVHLYRKYEFIADVTEIKLTSIYSKFREKTPFIVRNRLFYIFKLHKFCKKCVAYY